jgi:hypothetical protein
MNAVEKDGGTIVLGEIENEDTVPGFVSVGATLVGKDGNVHRTGRELRQDLAHHSAERDLAVPHRLPGHQAFAQVKSVKMTPNSMLVAASADPTIGVLHQTIDKDSLGKSDA